MFSAILNILFELAPWMLLGAVASGAAHILLPESFIHRTFNGKWGVVKAVLVGVPLPLCSCGVIPAAIGLRRDGASAGASTAFLISTPQTGVVSVMVTVSMVGRLRCIKFFVRS